MARENDKDYTLFVSPPSNVGQPLTHYFEFKGKSRQSVSLKQWNIHPLFLDDPENLAIDHHL